jgi:hypothetical protein
MPSISSIERILIIDDNERVRESYVFPIEAADREAVPREEPLGKLEDFLATPLAADAAVSDYHLSPGNYAFFDGATLVSSWYKNHFPAILCTQFEKANVARFRVLRRWIPVVLGPDELNDESLMKGLELVQREFQEEYIPTRRPWRALVRFVEFSEEENYANAKLPGWGEEVVALRANDLPETVRQGIRTSVAREEEYRCYAIANLGAESNDELYLSDWEVPTA